MPVLGTPTNKCDHGVYLAGELTARYCPLCNPDMEIPRGLPKGKLVSMVTKAVDERVMDAAEFMERSVGERLAAIR